jgi:hypothetical protein
MLKVFYSLLSHFSIFRQRFNLEHIYINVHIAKENNLWMHMKVLHVNLTYPDAKFQQALDNLLFFQLLGKGNWKVEVCSLCRGLGWPGSRWTNQHILGAISFALDDLKHFSKTFVSL